jgi:hypothetical protein
MKNVIDPTRNCNSNFPKIEIINLPELRRRHALGLLKDDPPPLPRVDISDQFSERWKHVDEYCDAILAGRDVIQNLREYARALHEHYDPVQVGRFLLEFIKASKMSDEEKQCHIENVPWVINSTHPQRLKGNGKAPPLVPEETGEALLETRRASSYKMRAIEWLWMNRFAYGKLGLLGGLPDLGKGLITAFLMACVTNGREFPCNEGKPPRKGSVIYLSAEDDVEDTIVPRLIAAGADLDRIHLVKATRIGIGKRKAFSLITDLEALRPLIDKLGDVSMIIIDPVASYVGGGKINTHMNSEVRSFLTPLTDMAAEERIWRLETMWLIARRS